VSDRAARPMAAVLGSMVPAMISPGPHGAVTLKCSGESLTLHDCATNDGRAAHARMAVAEARRCGGVRYTRTGVNPVPTWKALWRG